MRQRLVEGGLPLALRLDLGKALRRDFVPDFQAMSDYRFERKPAAKSAVQLDAAASLILDLRSNLRDPRHDFLLPLPF